MNPLETYIRELYDIRSTGAATPETSYYGPLAALLNEIGKTLKPKVRCIINLKNRGAGLPDGGLFTPDQFQKTATEPLPGTIPARGVIEVKPVSVDAWLTADGEQVSRYWGKYRQVLVTNLRDFLLVGQDGEGKQVKLEAYRLAPNEADFWREAAHPHRLAAAHGERFLEYLKRVMLQAAPLAAPKEVAWFLASYARDAKARIEGVALPALDTLRNALEEALGLKFEGTKADPDKGEHFFRSTLVQTIFYGVFSAWVLWSKKNPLGVAQPPPAVPDKTQDAQARAPMLHKPQFHWREATWHLHVPMIKALFEQLSMPSKLEPLGLVEVLDWTETCLNRVSRADFFAQFEEVHAVQYFYEPFLEAFDPKLRKDLGVWYTPPEIVHYMVARVDAVLRQELDIPDGLADPRVYVLDPCCGTGAYLVEVLKSINATLQAQGGDGLLAHKVKLAALSRVFGFEIMPAPFVVAHLQLGLYLQNLGAPLAEETTTKKGERAGVYLTNALTGWEPPRGPKKQLAFPQMEEERDAAEEVKRDKPILVILGNPPYNAFAGVSAEAEKILVEPYKEGLVKKWGIKKFNLDDLYVRFFGLAERRIAGMTGKGVVSYISNFSYLGDPSFLVMRQRFLAEFDALWFDCLNGDSRETGKITPDGKPDPSVFSTEYNREGIRVGTAVCLMVRREAQARAPVLHAKPAKGEYRRNLPHLQKEGRPLFVTFSTHKRQLLPESVRNVVLKHCLHDHGVKLWMHAAVVMPDHVHLLFTPLSDQQGNPYGQAEIMQAIKGVSAHSLNKVLNRRGRVWQEESFDRVLRSAESTRQKAEYICENPVRKGLVETPDDYPWTWREWVEGGAQAPSPVQGETPEAQAQARAPVLHPIMRFRHFWGVTKRADLLESLKAQDFEAQYQTVSPDITNRYTFRPSEVATHYREWPKLADFCQIGPFNGPYDARKEALYAIVREDLRKRMKSYYDPNISDLEIARLHHGLMEPKSGFKPVVVRNYLISKSKFYEQNIYLMQFKPWDRRFYYCELKSSLCCRPSPELMPHVWEGNSFVISRSSGVAYPEGPPIFFSKMIVERDHIRGHARLIPLRVLNSQTTRRKKGNDHPDFLISFPETKTTSANLSHAARTYLAALGLPDPDSEVSSDTAEGGGAPPEKTKSNETWSTGAPACGSFDSPCLTAGLIWMHALAVGYAPIYLTENADGIRQDWPRVPLPDTAEALINSARLGRQVAALLDPENPVPGVTAGAVRPEMKVLGVITREGGGALNPDAGDLALTVGWGHGGKDGITMPGKGKAVKREYTPEELAAIREGAEALGLTLEQALEHLGEATYDIYLNEVAYWRNIPEKVWNYYIGGYQVIKKWLSYREQPLLGRPLTPDEVEEVTHIARRLAAIVLLEPALNANYQAIKASPHLWPYREG